MSERETPGLSRSTGGWTVLRPITTSRLTFVSGGVIVGVLLATGIVHVVTLAIAPRLELSKARVDLGEIAPGISLTETVPLRNVGRRVLEITDIRSTCGCTVTHIDKTVLSPGEASELRISFLASQSMTSLARITIVSNDVRSPVQFLDIVARKPLSATVSPRTLLFQSLDRPMLPVTRQVVVTMTRKETFDKGNVIKATCSWEHIAVSVVSKPEQREYVVKVTLLDSSPSGSYRSKIHLANRSGVVNDDVEVDMDVRSKCFLPSAGFVVGEGGRNGERRGSDDYVLLHRTDRPVDVREVYFDALLRDLLLAERVESADKMKTVVRIHPREHKSFDLPLSPLISGNLFVSAVAGKEHAREVFCVPVTLCKTRRAR